MLEDGCESVWMASDVEVCWLEDRIRGFERLLGCKTLENEILKGESAKRARRLAHALVADGEFAVPRGQCRKARGYVCVNSAAGSPTVLRQLDL